MLGKRSYDERGDRRQGAPHPDSGQLHFRMLVGVKKAGSVIGKGGDFIQLTRKMTGAKVAVDKPVGRAEDRLVHVEGPDEPGKDLPGIQDAVLRTAERILGDENSDDGSIKLPHKCQLRMLLYKPQIGLIMGKKGCTINEMRNKSSATIKLLSPANGMPIVPCALPDDEMITIAGTPDQTLTALKMITDKLRASSSAPPDTDHRHHEYDRGSPVHQQDKRSRGEASGYGPPQAQAPPPHHMQPAAGGGHPPANVISIALPHMARNVLDNNDSVKTEGLSGLATVEYRFLVPVRRSGVILGNKGGVINDIRNRTGARVNLFDEEKNCGDRMLQIMSTEDVQDQHCAAFDAAMACVQALLHDELQGEPTGTVRVILQHGQVGAVMGKRGATIKELRSLSGASLNLSGYPDTPACVKKGEEVLEVRGPRNAVLLATHVALVAIRGNMARGQLIYKYPLPANAPPPTHHGPPPHMHMGPPPGGDPRAGHHGPPPHAQGPLGGEGRTRGSRWDSAEPRGNASEPGLQQRQPLPLPPGAVVAGGPPPPGVVYAQGPPPDAQGLPPQPQQVHYVQGPPPAGIPPDAQVHYIQGPPPGQQLPGPPQPQVVVYTSQPPPGATYVQQQLPPQQQAQPQQQQQQQQPVYVQQAPPAQMQQVPVQQQQQQPVQQVVGYPGGTATYVQGPPPQQQQQQQQGPPGSGQQVMYTTALPGQPPQQYTVDPNTHQPVAVAQHPHQQVITSGPPGTTTVVHGQPPQQVTYVYTQAPAPAPAAAGSGGPPAAAAGGAGASGPPSGYGGLAGLMAAVAAPPAAAPVAVAPPAAAPKARVLLTQDQVVKLRLNDPMQTAKLSALSGATVTLSDTILENGAREVLLAGTDNECNTATNLMEALMKSAS